MKFNLRDLMWLTLVAGVLAGWFAHYRSLHAELQAKEQELAEHRNAHANMYQLLRQGGRLPGT
jgi:hypothetical protein